MTTLVKVQNAREAAKKKFPSLFVRQLTLNVGTPNAQKESWDALVTELSSWTKEDKKAKLLNAKADPLFNEFLTTIKAYCVKNNKTNVISIFNVIDAILSPKPVIDKNTSNVSANNPFVSESSKDANSSESTNLSATLSVLAAASTTNYTPTPASAASASSPRAVTSPEKASASITPIRSNNSATSVSTTNINVMDSPVSSTTSPSIIPSFDTRNSNPTVSALSTLPGVVNPQVFAVTAVTLKLRYNILIDTLKGTDVSTFMSRDAKKTPQLIISEISVQGWISAAAKLKDETHKSALLEYLELLSTFLNSGNNELPEPLVQNGLNACHAIKNALIPSTLLKKTVGISKTRQSNSFPAWGEFFSSTIDGSFSFYRIFNIQNIYGALTPAANATPWDCLSNAMACIEAAAAAAHNKHQGILTTLDKAGSLPLFVELIENSLSYATENSEKEQAFLVRASLLGWALAVKQYEAFRQKDAQFGGFACPNDPLVVKKNYQLISAVKLASKDELAKHVTTALNKKREILIKYYWGETQAANALLKLNEQLQENENTASTLLDLLVENIEKIEPKVCFEIREMHRSPTADDFQGDKARDRDVGVNNLSQNDIYETYVVQTDPDSINPPMVKALWRVVRMNGVSTPERIELKENMLRADFRERSEKLRITSGNSADIIDTQTRLTTSKRILEGDCQQFIEQEMQGSFCVYALARKAEVQGAKVADVNAVNEHRAAGIKADTVGVNAEQTAQELAPHLLFSPPKSSTPLTPASSGGNHANQEQWKENAAAEAEKTVQANKDAAAMAQQAKEALAIKVRADAADLERRRQEGEAQERQDYQTGNSSGSSKNYSVTRGTINPLDLNSYNSSANKRAERASMSLEAAAAAARAKTGGANNVTSPAAAAPSFVPPPPTSPYPVSAPVVPQGAGTPVFGTPGANLGVLKRRESQQNNNHKGASGVPNSTGGVSMRTLSPSVQQSSSRSVNPAVLQGAASTPQPQQEQSSSFLITPAWMQQESDEDTKNPSSEPVTETTPSWLLDDTESAANTSSSQPQTVLLEFLPLKSPDFTTDSKTVLRRIETQLQSDQDTLDVEKLKTALASLKSTDSPQARLVIQKKVLGLFGTFTSLKNEKDKTQWINKNWSQLSNLLNTWIKYKEILAACEVELTNLKTILSNENFVTIDLVSVLENLNKIHDQIITVKIASSTQARNSYNLAANEYNTLAQKQALFNKLVQELTNVPDDSPESSLAALVKSISKPLPSSNIANDFTMWEGNDHTLDTAKSICTAITKTPQFWTYAIRLSALSATPKQLNRAILGSIDCKDDAAKQKLIQEFCGAKIACGVSGDEMTALFNDVVVGEVVEKREPTTSENIFAACTYTNDMADFRLLNNALSRSASNWRSKAQSIVDFFAKRKHIEYPHGFDAQPKTSEYIQTGVNEAREAYWKNGQNNLLNTVITSAWVDDAIVQFNAQYSVMDEQGKKAVAALEAERAEAERQRLAAAEAERVAQKEELENQKRAAIDAQLQGLQARVTSFSIKVDPSNDTNKSDLDLSVLEAEFEQLQKEWNELSIKIGDRAEADGKLIKNKFNEIALQIDLLKSPTLSRENSDQYSGNFKGFGADAGESPEIKRLGNLFASTSLEMELAISAPAIDISSVQNEENTDGELLDSPVDTISLAAALQAVKTPMYQASSKPINTNTPSTGGSATSSVTSSPAIPEFVDNSSIASTPLVNDGSPKVALLSSLDDTKSNDIEGKKLETVFNEVAPSLTLQQVKEQITTKQTTLATDLKALCKLINRMNPKDPSKDAKIKLAEFLEINSEDLSDIDEAELEQKWTEIDEWMRGTLKTLCSYEYLEQLVIARKIELTKDTSKLIGILVGATDTLNTRDYIALFLDIPFYSGFSSANFGVSLPVRADLIVKDIKQWIQTQKENKSIKGDLQVGQAKNSSFSSHVLRKSKVSPSSSGVDHVNPSVVVTPNPLRSLVPQKTEVYRSPNESPTQKRERESKEQELLEKVKNLREADNELSLSEGINPAFSAIQNDLYDWKNAEKNKNIFASGIAKRVKKLETQTTESESFTYDGTHGDADYEDINPTTLCEQLIELFPNCQDAIAVAFSDLDFAEEDGADIQLVNALLLNNSDDKDAVSKFLENTKSSYPADDFLSTRSNRVLIIEALGLSVAKAMVKRIWEAKKADLGQISDDYIRDNLPELLRLVGFTCADNEADLNETFKDFIIDAVLTQLELEEPENVQDDEHVSKIVYIPDPEEFAKMPELSMLAKSLAAAGKNEIMQQQAAQVYVAEKLKKAVILTDEQKARVLENKKDLLSEWQEHVALRQAQQINSTLETLIPSNSDNSNTEPSALAKAVFLESDSAKQLEIIQAHLRDSMKDENEFEFTGDQNQAIQNTCNALIKNVNAYLERLLSEKIAEVGYLLMHEETLISNERVEAFKKLNAEKEIDGNAFYAMMGFENQDQKLKDLYEKHFSLLKTESVIFKNEFNKYTCGTLVKSLQEHFDKFSVDAAANFKNASVALTKALFDGVPPATECVRAFLLATGMEESAINALYLGNESYSQMLNTQPVWVQMVVQKVGTAITQKVSNVENLLFSVQDSGGVNAVFVNMGLIESGTDITQSVMFGWIQENIQAQLKVEDKNIQAYQEDITAWLAAESNDLNSNEKELAEAFFKNAKNADKEQKELKNQVAVQEYVAKKLVRPVVLSVYQLNQLLKHHDALVKKAKEGLVTQYLAQVEKFVHDLFYSSEADLINKSARDVFLAVDESAQHTAIKTYINAMWSVTPDELTDAQLVTVKAQCETLRNKVKAHLQKNVESRITELLQHEMTADNYKSLTALHTLGGVLLSESDTETQTLDAKIFSTIMGVSDNSEDAQLYDALLKDKEFLAALKVKANKFNVSEEDAALEQTLAFDLDNNFNPSALENESKQFAQALLNGIPPQNKCVREFLNAKGGVSDEQMASFNLGVYAYADTLDDSPIWVNMIVEAIAQKVAPKLKAILEATSENNLESRILSQHVVAVLKEMGFEINNTSANSILPFIQEVAGQNLHMQDDALNTYVNEINTWLANPNMNADNALGVLALNLVDANQGKTESFNSDVLLNDIAIKNNKAFAVLSADQKAMLNKVSEALINAVDKRNIEKYLLTLNQAVQDYKVNDDDNNSFNALASAVFLAETEDAKLAAMQKHVCSEIAQGRKVEFTTEQDKQLKAQSVELAKKMQVHLSLKVALKMDELAKRERTTTQKSLFDYLENRILSKNNLLDMMGEGPLFSRLWQVLGQSLATLSLMLYRNKNDAVFSDLITHLDNNKLDKELANALLQSIPPETECIKEFLERTDFAKRNDFYLGGGYQKGWLATSIYQKVSDNVAQAVVDSFDKQSDFDANNAEELKELLTKSGFTVPQEAVTESNQMLGWIHAGVKSKLAVSDEHFNTCITKINEWLNSDSEIYNQDPLEIESFAQEFLNAKNDASKNLCIRHYIANALGQNVVYLSEDQIQEIKDLEAKLAEKVINQALYDLNKTAEKLIEPDKANWDAHPKVKALAEHVFLTEPTDLEAQKQCIKEYIKPIVGFQVDEFTQDQIDEYIAPVCDNLKAAIQNRLIHFIETKTLELANSTKVSDAAMLQDLFDDVQKDNGPSEVLILKMMEIIDQNSVNAQLYKKLLEVSGSVLQELWDQIFTYYVINDELFNQGIANIDAWLNSSTSEPEEIQELAEALLAAESKRENLIFVMQDYFYDADKKKPVVFTQDQIQILNVKIKLLVNKVQKNATQEMQKHLESRIIFIENDSNKKDFDASCTLVKDLFTFGEKDKPAPTTDSIKQFLKATGYTQEQIDALQLENSNTYGKTFETLPIWVQIAVDKVAKLAILQLDKPNSEAMPQTPGTPQTPLRTPFTPGTPQTPFSLAISTVKNFANSTSKSGNTKLVYDARKAAEEIIGCKTIADGIIRTELKAKILAAVQEKAEKAEKATKAKQAEEATAHLFVKPEKGAQVSLRAQIIQGFPQLVYLLPNIQDFKNLSGDAYDLQWLEAFQSNVSTFWLPETQKLIDQFEHLIEYVDKYVKGQYPADSKQTQLLKNIQTLCTEANKLKEVKGIQLVLNDDDKKIINSSTVGDFNTLMGVKAEQRTIIQKISGRASRVLSLMTPNSLTQIKVDGKSSDNNVSLLYQANLKEDELFVHTKTVQNKTAFTYAETTQINENKWEMTAKIGAHENSEEMKEAQAMGALELMFSTITGFIQQKNGLPGEVMKKNGAPCRVVITPSNEDSVENVKLLIGALSVLLPDANNNLLLNQRLVIKSDNVNDKVKEYLEKWQRKSPKEQRAAQADAIVLFNEYLKDSKNAKKVELLKEKIEIALKPARLMENATKNAMVLTKIQKKVKELKGAAQENLTVHIVTKEALEKFRNNNEDGPSARLYLTKDSTGQIEYLLRNKKGLSKLSFSPKELSDLYDKAQPVQEARKETEAAVTAVRTARDAFRAAPKAEKENLGVQYVESRSNLNDIRGAEHTAIADALSSLKDNTQTQSSLLSKLGVQAVRFSGSTMTTESVQEKTALTPLKKPGDSVNSSLGQTSEESSVISDLVIEEHLDQDEISSLEEENEKDNESPSLGMNK